MTNLVTNLDWKIFIEDKVYDRPEFWLSDGYDYIKRNKICKPLYWIDNEQLFKLAVKTKEILDNMYRNCQVNYIHAILVLLYANLDNSNTKKKVLNTLKEL